MVDVADAQSGELPSDPMEPLRRWPDLADAHKPLSTGRGRLHHSPVKVAVWLSKGCTTPPARSTLRVSVTTLWLTPAGGTLVWASVPENP